jgi:signal peptidase
MSYLRKFGWQTVEITLVIVVLALLLGQALGQPILLGFVETESMEPTLEPDDGFVAIPSPFAGSIEEGDVIVFEAQELHGGGLTTHRVVRETEQGYITKGDANPVLDQDGDEPPVQDEQVVAKALQINGEAVVIPRLGTVIESVREAATTLQLYLASLFGTTLFHGTQGFLNLILALCALAYVVLLLREPKNKNRGRDHTKRRGMHPKYLAAGVTLLLVLSLTATMVLPAGTHQVVVESRSDLGPQASGLSPGESETGVMQVSNDGFVPTLVIFEPETEGIEADPATLRVDGQTVVETEVTVTAPSEEDRVNRILVEHRYLAILPTSVLLELYQIHPWLPIAIINALIGIPFYLLSVTLIGTGRIRDRSRNRDLSVLARIRRSFRNSY